MAGAGHVAITSVVSGWLPDPAHHASDGLLTAEARRSLAVGPPCPSGKADIGQGAYPQTMKSALLWLAAIALSMLLLLGACARTEPARFYLLRPLAGNDFERLDESRNSAAEGVAIGIESVTVAPYLNRPEIATRRGPYRVQFADFDRWAEPLEDNIARVLAENLSVLLLSPTIQAVPPVASGELDYRLSIDVTRLDNEPGQEAWLGVRWTLWAGDERRMLVSRQADYREPLDSGDYESLAAANSRLLEKLSRDIAGALRDLPGLEKGYR